jgi:hypothetical protein
MALGVAFEEANGVLGAPTPEDAAAGTVYGLPIHRYRDLDGQVHVLSKWQLTPEELDEVARTGVVWFSCWGSTHAPMWISGRDPFVRSEPQTVAA